MLDKCLYTYRDVNGRLELVGSQPEAPASPEPNPETLQGLGCCACRDGETATYQPAPPEQRAAWHQEWTTIARDYARRSGTVEQTVEHPAYVPPKPVTRRLAMADRPPRRGVI